MSWRLLFFTLLVLAGIATMGGLYAGDWLIAHAPTQANLPNVIENDPSPTVDANGLPVLRQPPQPLMSGKMGVPDTEVHVDWTVKEDNLTDAKTASVASSTDDFGSGSLAQPGSSSTIVKTRPIGSDGSVNGNVVPAPAPVLGPPPGSSSRGGGWEPAFHREMAACRQLGLFERASCVGDTRQRYCGANNAWGQVKDCPARR